MVIAVFEITWSPTAGIKESLEENPGNADFPSLITIGRFSGIMLTRCLTCHLHLIFV
jgi:hypothetical protein